MMNRMNSVKDVKDRMKKMFLRKTKCRNDEKSGRRRKKLLLRPLPLSCLLHLIGLILLGLVLHNNAVQSEEQPPEAEIVMETAEAEMPPEAFPTVILRYT